MDCEKILRGLIKRFAAPLPEFYTRRIIFWLDEEKEFTYLLDGLELPKVKILTLTGTNNFYAKKILAEDLTGNYLVYRPFAYECDADNPLLDVELYSETFRADLVSVWMEELKLPQTPAMRRTVKQHRKFFNAQARRDKLSTASIATPAQLQLAIMASLAGLKSSKPHEIVKAVLKAENAVYREFVSFGVDEAFRHMIEQGTGFRAKEFAAGKLAAHILLTAATRTLPQKFFEEKISAAHQTFCYDFVSDWCNGAETATFIEIARRVEDELKIPRKLMRLTVDDLLTTEVFPCVDEVILAKIMADFDLHNAEKIIRVVEARRTCFGYDAVKNFYEGLLQAADMQKFFQTHADGFHIAEAAQLWQEYATDYFAMDACYRNFHRHFDLSLRNYHAELSNLFAHVAQKVESLYKNWYLEQLGANWSAVCAEELRDYGYVAGVPRQTDFYRRMIKFADGKIYVLISDALRYEVAATLAEQLQQETQAQVELKTMQAIFPTITKFGMAALLPHEKISIELRSDKLTVLLDGQASDAQNRDKILKAADPSSVALKYKDIIGKPRSDRQALVKGMSVVYIYHNTIDEAGHIDSSIFGACSTAVAELKNMVRIITNEWRGTNILITADHGFLYTHSPLTEDDKLDKTATAAQDVEVGRRYAITHKGAQAQFLLPIKFLDGKTPFDAFAPAANVRIKLKGGNLNFVHGGISLQEMVVPLIEYHFLRNQSKEYRQNRNLYDTRPVELDLLSNGRTISNMTFALNFYQKEPVGSNRSAATYRLYFADASDEIVSDVRKIIADKVGDTERSFRCNFNLKPRTYGDADDYSLIIADEAGQIVQRVPFKIDIASADVDFDFFA